MLRRIWLIPLTVLIVISVDHASKRWALQTLEMGQTKPFLPGLLQFTLTTNTGGAFGIGQQAKEIMMVLPILICAGIIYWIWKREKSGPPLPVIEQIGFGMLIGGALGNIADRLMRGMVTDFLEFAFVSFPVFNLADALIDVGIGLLIIATLLPSAQQQSKTVSDG